MQDKTTELFANAPVPKAVFSNAIPSIISMLMVILYNLADTFFIGQTNNAYMIAAVSIAAPAFLIFMAVGMLFGIGGTSFISRKLGAGEREIAKHTSSFCFWSCTVIGVVGGIFLIIFAEPICWLIGASNETIAYSADYLRIIALSTPFLILGNAFSNIVRSEGSPQVAMFGMILGNVVNIILDPIMILALGWEVRGAAIATTIGNTLSALVYIVHIIRKSDILSLNPKYFSTKDNILWGVVSIGFPASLNNILMSIANIIVINMMAKYDDMAVAGLGVAQKVNMIVVMLLIGLGAGIQPLLGYCYGAKNKKRYLDVLKFSTLFAFALSLVMTIICYFGAKYLVNAFLTDSAAFEYGFSFTRIYIYGGPILGIMFVFINAIQSIGAALPALILNLSRQGIVFIPLLFILNAIADTPTLIVAAQPITDYCSTTLAIILFIIAFRKRFNQLKAI